MPPKSLTRNPVHTIVSPAHSSSENVHQKPYIIDIYQSLSHITSYDVHLAAWDTVHWTDQTEKTTDLFTIWSAPKNEHASIENAQQPGNAHLHSYHDRRDRRIFDVATSTAKIAPLRLFDCKTERLRDRKTYLRETNGIPPEYIIVSQVWGDAKPLFRLPTVPWPILITSQAKWDAILTFCKRENVKWLWMDILCINQTNSSAADQEKKTEIPKMGQYYRGAEKCLLVPEHYDSFCSRYRQLTDPRTEIQSNWTTTWEDIGILDAIKNDSWFWRMWTYQELLLPKQHVLLDGRKFQFRRLQSLFSWYQKQLQSGLLTKPPGGTDYDFINVDSDVVISENWVPMDWIRDWTYRRVGNSQLAREQSWALKDDLDHRGNVDLITLVIKTREKKCTFHVDRLLGLYGLLSEAETVPIKATSDTSSRPTSALEAIWKETIHKVVSSGKVWPLLHDLMNLDPDEATDGERWIPEITALHRRLDYIDARPETLDHLNKGRITFTSTGLGISVRVVGQVVGTSVDLPDGAEGITKLLTCAWILNAKGLNAHPLVRQIQEDFMNPSGVTTPGGIVGGLNTRELEQAISAPTLSECFRFSEQADLRKKLATAKSMTGGDRRLLAIYIEGQRAPMLCLAWTHRSVPPMPNGCWVLDVTSDPISNVRRWVIANQVDKRVFRKIGTVRSHPYLVGGSVRSQPITLV